jgi:hypothetical protein
MRVLFLLNRVVLLLRRKSAKEAKYGDGYICRWELDHVSSHVLVPEKPFVKRLHVTSGGLR